MELEDEIIRQAQAGNQDAFRQLVEHYAALTRRTARLLLPAHLSAEEAAQEAWVDVWRGLPRFQTGRPFRPWLLTLVANRCRMLNRHRQLTYTSLDVELAEEVSDNKDWNDYLIRTSGDIELREALTKLPPQHRRILALRFWAELELDEIAQISGVPLGTVKSRLHRALNNLRNQLNPRSPQERLKA